VLKTLPEANGIRLPSGLIMRYGSLKATEGEMGTQFSYKTRRGWVNIYGGKVIENVCQAIARCVMTDQMLLISKRYPILLTVHDSVVCCVPDNEVDEAAAYVDACMRHTPDWAKGLPVRGDVEIGKNYGEVTEWVNPHGPLVA
jgi:DNA polymerase bacteriophage-type